MSSRYHSKWVAQLIQQGDRLNVMRISKAHISNYRSVVDSGPFEIEKDKTILVGVNEAGKTALLRAMQLVSPPPEIAPLDYLFDAPALMIDEIRRGLREQRELPVAQVVFDVEQTDLRDVPGGAEAVAADSRAQIAVTHFMDGHQARTLYGFAARPLFKDIKKPLLVLRALLAKSESTEAEIATLDALTATAGDMDLIWSNSPLGAGVKSWLNEVVGEVEAGTKEDAAWDAVTATIDSADTRQQLESVIVAKIPKLVYYSTYFTVRPKIHLDQLAIREQAGDIDTEYDFGNLCLLKFLGFSAHELSKMDSDAPVKPQHYDSNIQARDAHDAAVRAHERRLTERQKALDAAGARLTRDLRRVWKDDQLSVRFVVDGQYLQAMISDETGMSVELDQRSEGFRWLFSFFVVFYAQAMDDLKGAILLLDEPGMSLHALKQKDFRSTISELAEGNQVIYTTHSPFMVGTNELDLVRIVEMPTREEGTKVHGRLTVDDPRSIYPLQAALGYELGQSLFSQARNLVVEGVTDMFYVEGLSALHGSLKDAHLRAGTALVPAGSASKVVYYCTVLYSQALKVAALLDSDGAGDTAAKQEALWQLLPGKNILRVGKYVPSVPNAEIEDLLRETLTAVAKTLGWDSETTIAAQPSRPIVDILTAEHSTFSKFKLAKAFLQRLGSAESPITASESDAWKALCTEINKALA